MESVASVTMSSTLVMLSLRHDTRDIDFQTEHAGLPSDFIKCCSQVIVV